jgi:hypothetical protein
VGNPLLAVAFWIDSIDPSKCLQMEIGLDLIKKAKTAVVFTLFLGRTVATEFF